MHYDATKDEEELGHSGFYSGYQSHSGFYSGHHVNHPKRVVWPGRENWVFTHHQHPNPSQSGYDPAPPHGRMHYYHQHQPSSYQRRQNYFYHHDRPTSYQNHSYYPSYEFYPGGNSGYHYRGPAFNEYHQRYAAAYQQQSVPIHGSNRHSREHRHRGFSREVPVAR